MTVTVPKLPLADVVAGLERFDALDSVSEQVQAIVHRIVPDRSVLKDLLSGAWWGHPLHPMLTDVVIGAWTSAWFLDLLPSKKTRAASDRLIGIGILAAVPTAAAGLSDYSDLSGPSRRVGTVHALSNITALTLYSLSWLARKEGRRGAGWVLAMVGSGVATAGGYLGGHLSFNRGIGVNHTAFDRMPMRWTAVMDEEALPQEKLTVARAKDAEVLLYRRAGRIYAVSDRCTHLGCSLRAGHVEGEAVVCRCHGSTFDLNDGSVVHGPATTRAPVYETRVSEGRIEVRRAG